MEFEDLKHLREQAEGARGDKLQTPRDAALAARAQSAEVGALEATSRGVTVDGPDSGVEGSAAQAATLHAASGTARALPHAELIQAAFGQHSVTGLAAHTDARAEEALEALSARGLATADRVVLGADAGVREAAREAASALAQQAEADGRIAPAEREDGERAALVEAIAARTAEGRNAEDLLDRLTSEVAGRGEGWVGGGEGAAWDGVGRGEVSAESEPDAGQEDALEGELSPEEQAAQAAEVAAQTADQAAAQAAERAPATPWFEGLLRAAAAQAAAQEAALEAVAAQAERSGAQAGPERAADLALRDHADPPVLWARRRKRTGEGWLFDVPGPATAQAPGPAREVPSATRAERGGS